ncbi:hypothetical protein ILUMI_10745 [Ignelater luminosus]|uniref:Uncharacterized protein n=1 Tax=Ignelater luminosus TaxID=2038154 RepID=A0A8K0CXB9_IGNLU|nr:hypothetical protein ILUMI_10745 [Ignelater luminosus]
MQQVKWFYETLFASSDNIKQDTIIPRCCCGEIPKRRNKEKKRIRNVSITYQIPDCKENLVRVCKDAFLKTTEFSRFKIEYVIKKFLHASATPKARRGGNRVGNKNDAKKD